jgi:hypothetical protein
LILDTAALLFATLDGPRPRQAELTFKAGCLAMNRVYRFFNTKAGTEPIGLLPSEGGMEPGRNDFDLAYDELAAKGLRLLEDRDAAWVQFRELRGRYATALGFLARLTMAPSLKITA